MSTVESIGGRTTGKWGAVVTGLGIAFGAVEILHVAAMSDPVGLVLEALLPLAGAVTLAVAGVVLWTGRYGYGSVSGARVVAWTVGGAVGMGVIFLWILAHQYIRGGSFHHAEFILVNNLVAGGLAGFVIGTYDARSRFYRASIERERAKHAFLNRQLRHHVLNGMQVVLSRADALARGDGGSGDAASTIRRRGEEIVDRVESVGTIAEAFTETETTVDEQDLSAVLREAVDWAEQRYDGAVIASDVPEGVSVRADRHLPIVFENLLANAVEHSESDRPRVRVTVANEGEAAVVRVADDGPGLTDDQKEALLGWTTPSVADVDMGVGLAIVHVLVDRYGGEVRIEDPDPSNGRVQSDAAATGTVVVVELERTGG